MAENEGERQWIVEPPPPGQVALHLAFGDGVQLTAEQEAAVGELIRTLESSDPEVTGLTKCTEQSTCTNLKCTPVNCNLKCGDLKTKVMDVSGGWNLMGNFKANIGSL